MNFSKCAIPRMTLAVRFQGERTLILDIGSSP